MSPVSEVITLCSRGGKKRKIMYSHRSLFQSQWSEDRNKRRLGHLGTLFLPSLSTDPGYRGPTWLKEDTDMDMFFEILL